MGQRRMQLSERDRELLAWCGEQYTVRFDLLAMLMARMSVDRAARQKGRVSRQAVSRRARAWKQEGLADFRSIGAGESATLWLTNDGMMVAGLPWRAYEVSVATMAHRHAVGLIRAEAETMGLTWVCERQLREELAGRLLHLPDGLVVATDPRSGRTRRTAIEVELTRKTHRRVVGILRQLLRTYDDVVYRVHSSAATSVLAARAALPEDSAKRVHLRPYPPPTLADVA